MHFREAQEDGDPAWLDNVELPSFTSLLQTILYHCLESIADPRWELRRMGQQVLTFVYKWCEGERTNDFE